MERSMPQGLDIDARAHSWLVICSLAGVAVYTALIAADVGMSEIVEIALFHSIIAATGIACLVAAVRQDETRSVWTAFGVGLFVWSLADLYLVTVLEDSNTTFPSVPDAGFL